MDNFGLRITNEAHGLYGDEGERYFGLFQAELANIGGDGTPNEAAEDFSMVFGLRNSHDKKFSAGLALGSGVFVCDNLSFSAEVVIGRKHTKRIMEDLPFLVSRAVGSLVDLRQNETNRFASYKETEISGDQAAGLILNALDNKAINTTRVPKVWDQWKTPAHSEFAEATNIWRLFNGFTEVYKEMGLMDAPTRSRALHGILDAACGFESLGLKERIDREMPADVIDATVTTRGY